VRQAIATYLVATTCVVCGSAHGAGEGSGEPVSPILAAADVNAGLAVHLGTTDGQMEIELAQGGRLLVHGLAADAESVQKARAAIRAKGIYGLASVERRASFDSLPYADNLLNLLVADLDALKAKAPPRVEMLRVLCPKGIAYLKSGGKWSKTVKPRPAEMDDWTHFDYGPEGNGVSHDKLVAAPNFVQWISGVQEIKLGGNPAGFIGLTGLRAAGGRVVFDCVPTEKNKGKRESLLHSRDAFSGVPLWSVARDFDAGRKRWQLVAVGDRVYTQLKADGPLVAMDAATGKTLVTFDEAGPLRTPGGLKDRFGTERTQVRVGGGHLAVNIGDTLYLLDAATGRLRWKYREPDGKTLLWPLLAPAAGRAFIAVQQPKAGEYYGRWPYSDVEAVLCLDLSSGKIVWRNTEVAGKPVGQMVYCDGNLALFCGSAISGRGADAGGGWVSNITVADGKLQGQNTFKVAWNTSMYNAVVRDGAIWYAGHTQIFRADLKTAEVTPAMTLAYNQRCNRFCATDDLFITGYVTYLDRQFNGTLVSAARAGCSLGATPANGMAYFTPSACGCFTQLRGYLAMSPEAIRPPIDAAKRLEWGGVGSGQLAVGSGRMTDTTKRPEESAGHSAKGVGQVANLPESAQRAAPAEQRQVGNLPHGPIVDDWTRQPIANRLETEAVKAGAMELVAVIHEHRLEARDADGKVAWSFVAGGRISGPPLVHGDAVYFGAHDGWVYAVSLADGAPRWRYFAAPYERKMVAYGQLESSWPVYGVALHNGLICASAGLHPELGGGVYVCGLDPKSGAAVFRRALRKPPAEITTAANGKASGNIVPHCFLNEPIRSDGEQLCIGPFAFRPDETDAELQKRLTTVVPKKR